VALLICCLTDFDHCDLLFISAIACWAWSPRGSPRLDEACGGRSQPSRFEGWRSDIAVHREQAPPGALYVDPDRPDELAAAMAKLWVERDRPPPAPAEPFEARRNAFARAYEKHRRGTAREKAPARWGQGDA